LPISLKALLVALIPLVAVKNAEVIPMGVYSFF